MCQKHAVTYTLKDEKKALTEGLSVIAGRLYFLTLWLLSPFNLFPFFDEKEKSDISLPAVSRFRAFFFYK